MRQSLCFLSPAWTHIYTLNTGRPNRFGHRPLDPSYTNITALHPGTQPCLWLGHLNSADWVVGQYSTGRHPSPSGHLAWPASQSVFGNYRRPSTPCSLRQHPGPQRKPRWLVSIPPAENYALSWIILKGSTALESYIKVRTREQSVQPRA